MKPIINTRLSGGPIKTSPDIIQASIIPSSIWTDAAAGKIYILGDGRMGPSVTEQSLINVASEVEFKLILAIFSKYLDFKFGPDSDMKEILLLNAIVIAHSESLFNKIAVSEVERQTVEANLDKDQNIWRTKAKGYFQLLPQTFAAAAEMYNAPDSPWVQFVKQAGYKATLAFFDPGFLAETTLGPLPGTFDFLKPIAQSVPSAILLMANVHAIFEQWRWDDKQARWMLNVTPASSHYYTSIANTVPGALSDKRLGAQLLMTVYHINGANLINKRFVDGLPYQILAGGLNRYAIDVAKFLFLYSNITYPKVKTIFNL